MSTSTTPKWLFNKELADLKGKYITVETTTNKSFNGQLITWNPDNLDLCLANVKKGKESYYKVFLRGHTIAEILVSEQPFDLEALAAELRERLNLLEADVKVFQDARIIQVLNKVKVSEKGVEGSGPVSDRVRAVFEEFMESLLEEEEE
jgi:small nuclear ribonucleoprotein (snRNP)-like protein